MDYVGTELGVFDHATNWKAYVRSKIAKYLTGEVLEVGAGIGAFTESVSDCAKQWWCLEPDSKLISSIRERQASGRIPVTVKSIVGTLDDIEPAKKFDAIIYMDVLEHIRDDVAEARNAASRLAPGGRVIILAPAFQAVYSSFDAAIGHFRRYTRASLGKVRPTELQAEESFYLDAPGLSLSLANRLFLRSAHPTKAQIMFWDTKIVPIARIVDPLIGFNIGRSVVAVWRRN
jgi:SAM-dependent methyltransferase